MLPQVRIYDTQVTTLVAPKYARYMDILEFEDSKVSPAGPGDAIPPGATRHSLILHHVPGTTRGFWAATPRFYNAAHEVLHGELKDKDEIIESLQHKLEWRQALLERSELHSRRLRSHPWWMRAWIAIFSPEEL